MSYVTVDTFLQDRLGDLRIAVLGDVMLDRYIYGEVSRISPEAPVPVNRVTRSASTLGGAANVASNLSHLGCQVTLFGVLGNDTFGQMLRSLAQEAGIGTDGLVLDATIETISKVRVLDARQQMLRIDFENIRPLPDEIADSILKDLRSLCEAGLDGIVLSDYGKGFFTPSMTQAIIALAQEYDCITVVDPKGTSWEKYAGATYITPNLKELSEYIGYRVLNTTAEVKQAARQVKETLPVKNLVVTRSEEGISLFNDKGFWHCDAIKQTVFDVSGAGDTVVATLIAALAAGLSHREALWICNLAAGVVVKQVGTYPIHHDELRAAWNHYRQLTGRLQASPSLPQLVAQVRDWQSRGETVVFTNGCFDILHRGHVSYLKAAAALGDRLIIAVNSDASVRRLKGPSRPLNLDVDRAFILENLAFVDGVIIFTEDTPFEVLREIRPDILVKGGDYSEENVIGREWVREVRILPFEEGYSTTGLVDKIKEQKEA